MLLSTCLQGVYQSNQGTAAAVQVTISAAVLIQGARALGDRDLQKDLQDIEDRNQRQRTWLMTRIRQAAPQTLAVPS